MATGASRLSVKLFCEMPRRLKMVKAGVKVCNCKAGTCWLISWVLSSPSVFMASPESAVTEMPTS